MENPFPILLIHMEPRLILIQLKKSYTPKVIQSFGDKSQIY